MFYVPPKYRSKVSRKKRLFAKELRNNTTATEKIVWKALRCKHLGVKFNRQVVILGWIADFCCKSEKLVIEIDGNHHTYGEQLEKDAIRDNVMIRNGYTIIRFSNQEIRQSMDSVILRIQQLLSH